MIFGYRAEAEPDDEERDQGDDGCGLDQNGQDQYAAFQASPEGDQRRHQNTDQDAQNEAAEGLK